MSDIPRHRRNSISSAVEVALTPDLSKQARRERGLSQADVIRATGIQAYRLKMWEARGLSIEMADISKLASFYEGEGIDLAELAAHVARQQGSARESAGELPTEVRPALHEGFTYAPRPGFVFAEHLAPEVVDALMERMESNDDRIAELTAEAFRTTGFFDDVTGDTEAKARELVCTLAENHVIFRTLQGRGVVSISQGQPKTLGEYLGVLMQDCPILPLIAANSATGAEA